MPPPNKRNPTSSKKASPRNKAKAGRTKNADRTKTFIQTATGEKKFIGGAAMARRVARSAKATRIVRPDEKQHSMQTIPSSLPAPERFFAALLRSTVTEFLNSKTPPLKTWKTICERLRLPIPEGPLPATYPDANQHFMNRVALVMEEARHAVAEGVGRLHRKTLQSQYESFRPTASTSPSKNRSYRRHDNSDFLMVTLVGVEQRKKSGHTLLNFVSERPFSPPQLDSLRQGTVVACSTRQMASNVMNAYLGCLVPMPRDQIVDDRRFAVMIFTPHQAMPDSQWQVMPVACLLTEQRKFEACTASTTHSVPFLHSLLGMKGPTHTRFEEDERGLTVATVREFDANSSSENLINDKDDTFPWDTLHRIFTVKPLNSSQEAAARSFLKSEPNTITLIQGPPGTGKTTLLVSVICRYVMESIHKNMSRSLMVCAPTNKAVSVLCTRFLESIRNNKDQVPCNVVLLGDVDKLMDDDSGRSQRMGGESSHFRSIFLYTWIQTVLDDYGALKHYLSHIRWPKPGYCTLQQQQWALQLAEGIEGRLRRSLSLDRDIKEHLDELSAWLKNDVKSDKTASTGLPLSHLNHIINSIRDWKSDHIWQELLGSAHIVFCTLASAGASILRKAIAEVNDLIVDEAAAATEPEMYIPFQFRPERLLAVGDPKQLPATVTSQMAIERGLSRSLHERLMYDCNYKHIMLDVQYRMKPEISAFPSDKFYGGNLCDGENVSQPDYGDQSVGILHGVPYAFLQVHGNERQASSGSYENEAEALLVAKLVGDLQNASRRHSGKWSSPDRIRIITFYQAQVSLINRILAKRRCGEVVVATVDSSQGCEADIVIVSFVRSNSGSGKATVGFLSDDRRLNVAITRGTFPNLMLCNKVDGCEFLI